MNEKAVAETQILYESLFHFYKIMCCANGTYVKGSQVSSPFCNQGKITMEDRSQELEVRAYLQQTQLANKIWTD